MKPYQSHLEILFDRYSSGVNEKGEKVMTYYKFFFAIDEYLRKSIPLTNEITDEQLERSRELYKLATGRKSSEIYDAKEWADYNRLMEAVDSINGMRITRNMYSIEIRENSVDLLFMDDKHESHEEDYETYNDLDNPTLKDALQKILIKYYTIIREGKI